ncbi:MAG: ATP-dependent DNA helicase RecG [Actinomycetota bacterium]|nr:ATP-dependent DNA helicase RecG [Actinomycetota bacterium]
MSLSLDAPVREVDPRVANRRVGMREKGPPAFQALADGLGIETVRQLLHHYPRRYIDRSQVARIRDLRVGQQATIIATVRTVKKRLTRRRQSMVTVTLWDGSGYLHLNFFNQPWTATSYKEGHELAVSGTVALYGGALQMAKQEVEVLRGEAETIHTGRITPVHGATEGITTRTIRELVFRALEQLAEVPDALPDEVVGPEEVASYDWALRNIHFPQSQEELARAQERLKFDELFVLELGVGFRKHRVAAQEVGVAHRPDGELIGKFVASLPFELTEGQRRAIEEISGAMARPHPMNLLLQGDVGSGKTVVALAACLAAVESGHQAAIMAPTEVLAGQHARNAAALLEPIGAVRFADAARRRTAQGSPGQESLLAEAEPAPALTFALLTAAVTGQERTRVLDGVRSGEVDLVVGTHALVQEAVGFLDLSLAVVDEQHRFGVHQRMALKGKGASPDVLIMTATPIPRTLALTYYGDLDVAVLDELPAGRQPVETRVVRTAEDRALAYDVVRREVQSGRQAFVVCAAIDEDNRLEVKAAEKEAERLATEVFPDLRVNVLHGRMRPAEKESRMDEYRAGRFDLLISTTVIEVGVDVPNATVMLVENAERFGLAQLHQLRGRIGRGAHRSYCYLFDESAPDNELARERLDAMVRTTDGFELADEDLRLRGEGTLFDIRQSGMPDLKLARLAEDVDLVRRARARAFALIDQDPELTGHPALRRELEDRFAESIDWLFHS